MLIKIENINKSFPVRNSLFCKHRQQVLKGVNFALQEGECLGIVGESGSGKSTLGKILLNIEKPDSGHIVFNKEMQGLPRHQAISVVFQDYNSSVNPRLSIYDIIAEPLLRSDFCRRGKKQHIHQLLAEVGLPEEIIDRYPHQLSGGQLQRVCIARAIAPSPKFILFDEAVSSLDVSIQVQILDLLLELKRKRRLSYLFITHDIAVAAYMCERLLFFHDGTVVEELQDLNRLHHIEHQYTRQLLDAAGYLELPYE